MEGTPGTNGSHGPTDAPPQPVGRSQHEYMSYDALAASLTRFEMGIIRIHEAFSSWARELQKYVAGAKQLSFQEVALLHCVRLRGGSTTMSEMMLFLHRHDPAAINYSLRKLEQQGFIKRARGPNRREVAYSVTDEGRTITDAYGRMRYQVLVQLCREVLGLQASTNEAAAVMERMIGIYDQAAQSILNQSLIAGASRIPQAARESASHAPAQGPAQVRSEAAARPISAAQAKRTPPRPRPR